MPIDKKKRDSHKNQSKWDEFCGYITCSMMLDECRNLFPDDLQ